MEGPLNWSNEQDGSGFPLPPLAPSNNESREAVTSPKTVQGETQYLCIRSCLRASQLQRGTIFTNCNGDACAQQAKEKDRICGALQQRICPEHIV